MLLPILAAALVAPPIYVTQNYGLSFRPPPGAYYCPLPRRWIGSDHGTLLFLGRPSACGGAGYPSISRSFEAKGVPMLSVYYGYGLIAEDRPAEPEPCQKVGEAMLLGHARPVCKTEDQGFVTLRATAEYGAGDNMEVAVSLTTERAATEKEIAVFRELAASVTPCGIGEPSRKCPGGRWF